MTENTVPQKKLYTKTRAGLLVLAALVTATVIGHLALTATATPSTPDFVLPPSVQSPQPLEPSAEHPVVLGGRLDRAAVLAGENGRVRLELSMKAAELQTERYRVPTDFAVVLDRSGSMEGHRLETARAAVHELLSLVGPDDRFTLVTYESGAQVTIALAPATTEAVASWRRQVDAVTSGGGTNMSLGLDTAISQLRTYTRPGAAQRIVLLSDGHANVGDPSLEGLAGRGRQASADEIVVTTVGIGTGFNEVLMAAIADAGTGNYYFVNETQAEQPMQLASIFSEELAATRETVARSLAVEIEPGSGVRVVEAAGYPLEHLDGRVSFRPGTLFSGQERRVWVTFEVAPEAPEVLSLGTVRARYTRDGAPFTIALAQSLEIEQVRDEQRFAAKVDREAWERGVVEEEYNKLRAKVASHVRSGKKEEARQAIEAYRVENARLNAQVQSARVEKNLQEEVQELEAQVEDAFTGQNQVQKQSMMSKRQQELSRDLRRIGSKKVAVINQKPVDQKQDNEKP